MVKLEYSCLDCGREFPLEVGDLEYRSSLSESHDEVCPRCGQRVGYGHARCDRCGRRYVAFYPHGHVLCSIIEGACPDRGVTPMRLCFC